MYVSVLDASLSTLSSINCLEFILGISIDCEEYIEIGIWIKVEECYVVWINLYWWSSTALNCNNWNNLKFCVFLLIDLSLLCVYYGLSGIKGISIDFELFGVFYVYRTNWNVNNKHMSINFLINLLNSGIWE